MPTDAVADPVSAWARSTLDNLLDEIFVVDSDSRVVYANRAACKNLGYTQEETCELSVADFDAHMTPEIYAAIWNDLIVQGHGHRVTRHRRKSGSTYPAEVRVSLIRWGEDTLACASVRDTSALDRIETTLKQSQERFRDFAEAGSDLFCETDQDLRYVQFSAPTERILGLAESELIGRYVWDIGTVPGGLEAMASQIECLKRHRTFRDLEVVIASETGQERIFRISGKPVFESGGRFASFRLVWKEVTDAVRSERERSRLADLLRGVIDASPAAIVLFAPVYDESNAVVDFRYEVVNGVTERLLDMSEAEIIGKLLSEVLPNHGRAVTAYRDVFETGTPKVTEVHVTDLGIDKWFRLTIGKAGDRVAVTGSDITAYKEALEELSVKEERLELAVTGGSDGLWDRDLVTGEMYFSPRWCEMLGYTTGEFASGEVTWAGLVHPDDFREARRRVVRVLEGLDDSYQSEHRLRHRDGTYRWFRARGRVVRNEEGRPVRFVGLSSDISDRKRLEEDMATARDAAEKANAAKSQFLANMSHELRTPLNAIIGFSEILAGGIVNVDLDQQRSYASHILDGGRHLLALINDILDLSKAEAGKLEPQPEYFKLAEVVSIANDMLAGSARKKGVRIDTDIQGDISKLYADRRMVLQVLINIVSNAIKFTGENGRVAIEGQHMADGSVRIRIRDTGIGISPNDIETVLSPFGQVDNKLNRSHMGTGLGLPLSRRLMELHGGTLQLDSTPGEGTTVTLVFPPEMLLAGL